jgi:muconate cycloisomerase
MKPQCAARAALEIALLDAAGRHFHTSLSSLVTFLPDLASISRRSEEVRYGVILSADTGPFKAFLYRLYGFPNVKLKVGGEDLARDLAYVAKVRRAVGGKVDIRVDANCGWSPKDAVKAMKPLAALDVSFIEQPVPPEQMMEFAKLRGKESAAPGVMLDESLISERDAQLAVSGRLGDAFNLRLSKNGGMIPLMHLAKLAINNRIGIQLGCHPGETAILSAAGRAVACSIRNLLFLEGSYDRHALARNVSEEDITFERGGRARRLTGAGLGITVLADQLDALTVQKTEIL